MKALWPLLWPDYSAVDADLQEELQKRGLIGLRILSLVAILLPAISVVLLWPLDGVEYRHGGGFPHLGWFEEAVAVAVGLAGLAVSRTRWGERHSRGLAVGVGFLVTVFAVAEMLATGGYESSAYSALVVVLLVMVAAVPLRPLAFLGIGLATAAMFAVSAAVDPTVDWPPPVGWYERLILLVVVALLSTGLAALITYLHIKEHQNRAELAESLEALRRTQASLISSKRAASQGKLAAALSHEINSPLGVLMTTSQLIDRYLDDLSGKCGDPAAVARLVSQAKEASGTSREALGRIRDLLTRFERFTHVDTADRRPVDVNALLEDTIGVLAGGWEGELRVIRDYGELPTFMGHAPGLSEVFRNILSNAAEALEDAGEIRITTRYARAYIWIQIVDTGRGIDMEDLTAIFDPRFRVRDGHVRTGWGLFISRQIIHDHNGEFRISSEPARGTEVEICLPVGRSESDGAVERTSASDSGGGDP